MLFSILKIATSDDVDYNAWCRKSGYTARFKCAVTLSIQFRNTCCPCSLIKSVSSLLHQFLITPFIPLTLKLILRLSFFLNKTRYWRPRGHIMTYRKRKFREVCQGTMSLKFSLPTDATKFLCVCKRTKNPPFCDGSHSNIAGLSSSEQRLSGAEHVSNACFDAQAANAFCFRLHFRMFTTRYRRYKKI